MKLKIGIVPKLFMLTTALCLFIAAILFIGQTVFFQQFYANQKVEDVKEALQRFARDYAAQAEDAQAAAKLEQAFYQQHNTWVAVVDDRGYLRHADDFSMEVRLETANGHPDLAERTLTVPLYTVMNVEDFSADNPFLQNTLIQEGQRIAIEGILMDHQLVPLRVGRDASNLREENRLINEQLEIKEYEVVMRYDSPTQYHEQYPSVLAYGTITKVRTPEGAQVSRYMNRLFLEKIKAFQADLLYRDAGGAMNQVMDYEHNQVSYKMFVHRIPDQAGAAYAVALTSLQPVSEAAGAMRDYYGYMIIVILLLALLASFYYSRRIARPLLRINDTTRRMARLDFSEQIPVATKDEIGDLSANINELSERLHSHIVRLEQDIEKEKQLEHTRKAFIAGVSHELKTPLSVIQSCLSILKDGVASHKREHYFAAMEEEVKKMDLLIADMLELAKYESGTYRMTLAPFRLDALVQRIGEKFASGIAEKRLRLHTRIDPVEVVASERRIEQVLVNFLSNAIRYTPEGQDIIVSTSEERDAVRISIENKGAHIPADQMEHIWDRFYRGERSRRRADGGTGLGLAICKQILELHQVPYGAFNTEDGVMFYFHLNKKQ